MRLQTSPCKALAGTSAAGALLSMTLLASGCAGSGSATESESNRIAAQEPSSTAMSNRHQPPPTTDAAPARTRRLDSIAVLGHSGATGTMSDPGDPSRDAHENSWATGDNPEVESIYLRLREDHPDLKGHNFNAAVNGTT